MTRAPADAVRGRMARTGPFLALGTAGFFAVLLVALAPRHSPMAIGFVAAATASGAAVAVLEARRPRLRARHVAAVVAVVLGVAIATPPRTSNDLWSYTMYGRIVADHGASPYDKVPSDFRSDPFFGRVSPIWRDRASVFGPVWVAFSAGASEVGGDSPLANRLAFQLAAGLAVGAVLLVVWRRTRSPAALAWFGLHPVVVVAVNGGHNDLWVGLGILAAALLAARRRAGAAGVLVGLVALVKLTALLALAGIVLWLWHRRDRAGVLRVALAAGAVVAVGYAPFVGTATHVLGEADHTVTAGSLWNPLAEALVGHDAGRSLSHPLGPNATLDALFFASLALVAAVAMVAAWRRRARPTPVPGVAAASASYAVAAEYTLPWYATWALPSFTSDRPSRLAWLVWFQAAFLLAALKLPIHASGSALDVPFRAFLSYVAPVGFAVAFVYLAVGGAGRGAAADPAPSAPSRPNWHGGRATDPMGRAGA
ncbi:MAG TPA: glycosyltransferase 87 family protein [Acidimicrobiia bacterium]|nr:glycosyltransferase 87 family protein [Acidimicrobiia bacterium]